MKHSLRTLALGAALAAGMTSIAAAQTPQRPDSGASRQERVEGRRHGGRHGIERGGRLGRALFRGIDLTDQQKQQVRTIREKYRPQYQALRKPANADGVRQRPDSATMAQVRSIAEKERGEVRAVLTPAQQTVFDQNLARIRDHAREVRSRRS
jgi:Spy/CpxP family protein refolding chaperone